MSAEEATINPDGTQTMGEDAAADAGADYADAGAGADDADDADAGEEDFGEGAEEAAEEGDYKTFFDDDKYKEYEIEAQDNFWSMFNSAPATWTPSQWGFFAGIMTIFMIIFCCIFRIICPCCSRR